MKTNLLKLLSVVAITGLMVMSASAIPITVLTIGDGRELGFVTPGTPADEAGAVSYINQLIGMGLGAFADVESSGNQINHFERSENVLGPLDSAVEAGHGTRDVAPYNMLTDSTVAVDLGLGYLYLVAKYDGQNDISEIWYVGGLSGLVSIPLNGLYGHGLSGVTSYNPHVPDGGLTVGLLGLALGALGLTMRKHA